MSNDNDERTDRSGGAWVRCAHCGEWFCIIHELHTYDCDCPPVEEWSIDPYIADDPADDDGQPTLFDESLALYGGAADPGEHDSRL